MTSFMRLYVNMQTRPGQSKREVCVMVAYVKYVFRSATRYAFWVIKDGALRETRVALSFI